MGALSDFRADTMAVPYSESPCSFNSKVHLPLFQAFNHPLAPPSAKRVFVMYLDPNMEEGTKEILTVGNEVASDHTENVDSIGTYYSIFPRQKYH